MEAKVRISYGTKAVELEGSEAFVREQLENLDVLLDVSAANTTSGNEDQETPAQVSN